MAQYDNTTITLQGQALLAKSVAGMATVDFTAICTSNYQYPSGTDYSSLTTLAGIQQTIPNPTVKRPQDTQVVINALAQKGIMISGQSTCSSKKHEYSQVLKNMGFDLNTCRNSLRVSFWHQNTEKEVTYFLKSLKEVSNDFGL